MGKKKHKEQIPLDLESDTNPRIIGGYAGESQLSSFLECLDFFTQTKIISLEDLQTSLKEFNQIYESHFAHIRKSKEAIGEQPLLTAVLAWLKKNYINEHYPLIVKFLIHQDLIPFKDSQGKLKLIKELKVQDFLNSINHIRSRKDLEIWRQEALINALLSFAHWLSQGIYAPEFAIIDPDRARTHRRLLSYDEYIRFLDKLDEKSQLVAKLLYLGGSRTLVEVLNANIEDIDFKRKVIKLGGQDVSYPRHIFEDLKIIIQKRKIGKIFTGRQNSPLNAATIFRNFKEVSSRIGLGDSFSQKTLTTDI